MIAAARRTPKRTGRVMQPCSRSPSMSEKSLVDVAPSRNSAKTPPIAQASATTTDATKDHPATFRRPPRVTAIVKLAAEPVALGAAEGRKRVHEGRQRADAVDEEGGVQRAAAP